MGRAGVNGVIDLRILNLILLTCSSLSVMATPSGLYKVSGAYGHHHTEKSLQPCRQVARSVPSSGEGRDQLGHLEDVGAALSLAQNLHPAARLAIRV